MVVIFGRFVCNIWQVCLGCLESFVWKVCLGFLGSLFGKFRTFVWDAMGGVNGAAGGLSNSSLQPLKTPTPPYFILIAPHSPPIQIPLSPADPVQLSVWLHQIAASSQSSAEAGRGCQGVLIQSPAALFNSRFTAGAAAAAAAAARRLRRGSSGFWCLKNIVIVFLPSHQTPKINFSFLSSETDKFFFLLILFFPLSVVFLRASLESSAEAAVHRQSCC